MIQLPESFILRIREQLGDEASAFISALDQPSPTSIRLHHKKGKSDFTQTEQVPWCAEGRYLASRPAFYLDPHWHGAAYYVQEASSMILDHVVDQIQRPEEGQIWVDLCAAPGGKTGILAKHLRSCDLLLANEVVSTRRSVLWENLTKAGYLNTFLSGAPVQSFKDQFADLILVDAPCAGEGMMRKESEAINQWDEALVTSCSILQKDIVQHAANMLNPGGYLIYSTCSYSREENIKNVAHFIREHQLTAVPVSFPESWGIATIEDGDAIGYQLYPHRLKGEGLFIALLKNEADTLRNYRKPKKPFRFFKAIPSWLQTYVKNAQELAVHTESKTNELVHADGSEIANTLCMFVPKARAVVCAGELKGRDFIPDHSLSSATLASSHFAQLDVDPETALDYLERNAHSLPPGGEKGWYIIGYNGTNLGWAKWTGQVWKNHYPMSWRLRHRHK